MARLIPNQKIDLSVAEPTNTANLSKGTSKNFTYSANDRAWVLARPGGVNFTLQIPQAQTIQLVLEMRKEKADGTPYLSITVNHHSRLIRGVTTHSDQWHLHTFFLPVNRFNAGENTISITDDVESDTSVLFRSVGVMGVLPQTMVSTAVDFAQNPPKGTTMLSLTSSQNSRWSPTLQAWELFAAEAFLEFNFAVEQLVLTSVSINFCSIAPGPTNNPFTILVNKIFLVTNYDPQRKDFHDESWLIPTTWIKQGSNTLRLQLATTATTSLGIKSFGILGQLTQPSSTTPTVQNQDGFAAAKWLAVDLATTYGVEFYELEELIFSSTVQTVSLVLPELLKESNYKFRVRAFNRTLAGPWSDFVGIKISRAIFLFSAAGIADPEKARAYLKALGVMVFAKTDSVHLVGLVDSQQLDQSDSEYFSQVTTGPIQEIDKLPPSQKPAAELWNYYVSNEYQQRAKDLKDDGIGWGDPRINAPPTWIPPRAAQVVETLYKPGNTRPISGTEFVDFEKKLQQSLGDVTIARKMALAAAGTNDQTRDALLELQQTEDLKKAVSAPQVQAKATISIGLIIVQSKHQYNILPSGWTLGHALDIGSAKAAIISGKSDPATGDRFSIRGVFYTVTGWDPMTQTIDFSPSTSNAFPNHSPLEFTEAIRMGPRLNNADYKAYMLQLQEGFSRLKQLAPSFAPSGWSLAKEYLTGSNRINLIGSNTYPQVNDNFTLEGSSTVYRVVSFNYRSLEMSITPSLSQSAARETKLQFLGISGFNVNIVEKTVEIDVGDNYDGKPWLPNSSPEDYWILPAIGTLEYKGKRFPPSWNGVQQYRTALNQGENTELSAVFFVGAFNSQGYAFAYPDYGVVVMDKNLLRFYTLTWDTYVLALDNRDTAAIRIFFNANLKPDEQIPSGAILAVTVIEFRKRWIVEVTSTWRVVRYVVVLSDQTWYYPDRLYIFAEQGWTVPSWGSIATHELLHLYGASDEYKGEGTPCVDCAGAFGDFKIPNGNCAECMVPQHVCFMASGKPKYPEVCDYTHGQIGWSDILIELTTAQNSSPASDEIFVKFGESIQYLLKDSLRGDRLPGQRDPYGLGRTRLTKDEISMISFGNDSQNLVSQWRIQAVKVWVQGELLYQNNNANVTIDKQNPWWIAANYRPTAEFSGFYVEITTSTEWFSGTSDPVYITLGGVRELLNPWWFLLSPYAFGPFSEGKTTIFTLDATGRDVFQYRDVTLFKGFLNYEAIYTDDWRPASIKISGLHADGTQLLLLNTVINQLLRRNGSWTGTITASR